MAKKEQNIDPEKAKEVLQQESQKASEDCQKEIAAILKKYNRQLVCSMLVTDQGNRSQVIIAAAPPANQ